MDLIRVLSMSLVLFDAIFMLATDMLLYGAVVPFVGTLLGSAVARGFAVSPLYECYLVILGVVVTFYAMFTGFHWMESRFWKRLFAQDKRYHVILLARDLVNLYSITCSFSLLFNTMMMFEKQGMKKSDLGEGSSFVLWNTLAEKGYPVPIFLQERYSWTPETLSSAFWDWGMGKSALGENTLKMYQMVDGAKIVLAIAGITASVMKFSYFSILHTYLRAMKIFTSMQDASPPHSRGGPSSMASMVSDYVSDFTINASSHKVKTAASNPVQKTL